MYEDKLKKNESRAATQPVPGPPPETVDTPAQCEPELVTSSPGPVNRNSGNHPLSLIVRVHVHVAL